MAYHIIAATALAYVLWFQLLEHHSATVASLTTLAVPVIGVLGAMALVGDRPSGLDGAGFALVLVGAGLAAIQGSKAGAGTAAAVIADSKTASSEARGKLRR